MATPFKAYDKKKKKNNTWVSLIKKVELYLLITKIHQKCIFLSDICIDDRHLGIVIMLVVCQTQSLPS